MAAKRRGLTDIVMGVLLPLLCVCLIAWSAPAAAKNENQDDKFSGAGGNLQPSPTIPAAPAKPAPAQTAPQTQPGPATQDQNKEPPINLIADEVGHDENLGIFVARGHVEILREGKIVKADVVTYNERTKRITAAGNVVLINT
ncbi:MAG TPA: hypothetical protein VGJ75_00650, partial [Dongiaceae bacterium]